MSLRIINSGVDTLALSIKRGTDPDWFEMLEDAKEWCRENNRDIPLTFGPERVLITGSNWMRCRYHLKTADYDIGVSPSKSIPQILAQINSVAFYSHGLEAAYKYLMMILETLGNYGQAKASRIDLFCDVQGWKPKIDDWKRFVTRAVLKDPKIEHYELTSLNFGAFPLYLRIYDKTKQIKKLGKKEIILVWEQSSKYDKDEDVWRIEYEIGREVFGKTGIDFVDDLYDKLLPLWLMALKWCSLRVPTNNKQKSRWPVDPVWKALEEVDFAGASIPAVRERRNKGKLDKLIPLIRGCLTSVGAQLEETDLKKVLSKTDELVTDYLNERKESFDSLVQDKINVLLK